MLIQPADLLTFSTSHLLSFPHSHFRLPKPDTRHLKPSLLLLRLLQLLGLIVGYQVVDDFLEVTLQDSFQLV